MILYKKFLVLICYFLYTKKEGFKKCLKKYIYEFSFQTPYVFVNKTDLFFALYE